MRRALGASKGKSVGNNTPGRGVYRWFPRQARRNTRACGTTTGG